MRVVVVGASVAGIAACNGLRTAGFDGEIVLVGEEAHPPYDRPPLTKQFLRGAVEREDIGLAAARGLDEADVLHRRGCRARSLDPGLGSLRLDGEEELPFDGLVIATGSVPRRLRDQPNLPGVHTVRTLDDAVTLRRELAAADRLTVIGAGFIGLEVAASARSLGVPTTVVESAPAPLARVFGPAVGARFSQLHSGHGVDLRCGASVTDLRVAGDRVVGVDLGEDGVVESDVVVVGVGAMPATDWLAGSGLRVDDGLVCDATLRTAPRIYGAGDVARWEHPLFGSIRVEHWMSAAEHGRAAAANLAAELTGRAVDVRPVRSIPYFWSDQFEVKVQMCGWSGGYDEVHELSQEQGGAGILFGRSGVLVAAMGWNAPAFVGRQRAAIAAGSPFAQAIESAT